MPLKLKVFIKPQAYVIKLKANSYNGNSTSLSSEFFFFVVLIFCFLFLVRRQPFAMKFVMSKVMCDGL